MREISIVAEVTVMIRARESDPMLTHIPRPLQTVVVSEEKQLNHSYVTLDEITHLL